MTEKQRKEPFGRPREYDREKIAKDMLEWSRLHDSINLNKFCAIQQIAPSKITDWAREEDYFRLAYEEAKANLGYRREQLLTENKLHVKAYDLNASTYDHFLKMDRREQKVFEAELDKANIDSEQANLAKLVKSLEEQSLSQKDES